MADREKMLTQLAGIGIALDMAGYHADAQCVRDVLALLREQQSVKPTAKDEAIRVKYKCGGCGYLVGFVSTIHDDMQYRAKFCPECGKRVKWDG